MSDDRQALRRAMEAALVADPDDLATHSAYADLLVEMGDPRGEFIQVQLALEDPWRTSEERVVLREREEELLGEHCREWLGGLVGSALMGNDSEELRNVYLATAYGEVFKFARGWLHRLRYASGNHHLVDALRGLPTARLLRELRLMDWQDPDQGPADGFRTLAELEFLDCLQHFQFGDENGPDPLHADALSVPLAKMSRLEHLELYAAGDELEAIFALPFPHLRSLVADYFSSYPLDVLASNPSLGRLEMLECWTAGGAAGQVTPEPFRALCFSPHLTSLYRLALYQTGIGDDGARALVDSGILRRLRLLDLHRGCISDAGALALAACPDLRHLQYLRLSANALTERGVAALRATGIDLDVTDQYEMWQIDQGHHLADDGWG